MSDVPVGKVPQLEPKSTYTKEEYEAAGLPTTFLGYLKNVGPGIVIALSWLGAGDIVDSTIAGSQFGYALLWVLLIAVILRWVFVDTIGKYSLCNVDGETNMIKAFSHIGNWMVWVLLIVSIGLGHFLCTFLLKGAASGLQGIFGGNLMIWAILCIAGAYLLTARTSSNIYKNLEITMKIILGLVVVAYIIALLRVGVDVPGFAGGIFGRVPVGQGAIDIWVMGAALIGTIAGSMLNLAYPVFLEDKGWKGPIYRKVQKYDLLFGAIIMFLINCAVWTVASQVLYGTNPGTEASDLAAALGGALGLMGEKIFFIALFAAGFTSVLGVAYAFTRIATQALHHINPERDKKFENDNMDPLYKVFFVLIGITPLLWNLPGAPSLGALVVFGTAIQAPVIPIIACGMLYLCNNKKLMLPGTTNKWWENVLVSFLVLISVYTSIKMIIGLVTRFLG